MKLEGLHHITMITGDAQRNVDFYADVLGLRLVKKTVNFDQPDAYHLYFGDEQGTPGSILTWFEFAGAAPGRAGAGMIHRIQLGVASEAALDFWAARLADQARASAATALACASRTTTGSRFELVVAEDGNPPLRAEHPEVPAEHAILGLEGARAYARATPAPSTRCSPRRSASPHSAAASTASTARERHVHWAYDAAPAGRGRLGRRHGAPHRLGVARRGPPRAGRQRVARGRRARHRRPRPRLLPLDLLPRAARRPVRDRHPLARLRGRRGPGAPRRGAARCPSSTRTCASGSSARLTPVANPRAARAREAVSA